MKYRWIMLAGLLVLLAGILLNTTWTVESSSLETTADAAGLGMMLLDADGGVSVLAVQEGSAAERAGIRPTDILMQLNGVSFTSVDELETLLQGHPEEDICLQLLRADDEMEICFPISP